MGLTDFEILTKIGEGSFSSVWLVRRISDGQEYALKKVKLMNLSSKEKQSSVNEVRILASLQQSNVIGYKEAFLEENATILCIIMEYAGGGDLYQKIQLYEKSQAYFREQEVWNYAVQMILGLRALHKMKILHRDLKSANIFLSKDAKEAKIGDLNVSKVLKSHLSYTQTGTPYYASPEVWRDQPYDMKSDIWSLGCVIYEIATLKTPFRAKDMDGLYKKIQKGTFSRIPVHYSDDLMTLISMCLKLSAAQRPTCEALLSHPVLQRNCQAYLKSIEEAPFIKDTLLETIRIPKNLRSLGSMLPKPNYMRERVNTEAVVDIRKLHQKSEVNIKNYMSLGNDSISKSIPTEADYSSAKIESSAGSRLGTILRTDSRSKKPTGEPETLRQTGSSENLYVKVRKIKLDDFSMPKEVTVLSENMKNLKPTHYKYLVAKKVAKNPQQQGTNDSKNDEHEVEVKRKSLNPNTRSKSTVIGIVDPDKPRRSLATAELRRISVLDNGKGTVHIKDIFPQKILLKPADIVSSYRNQNNLSEEKNNQSLNNGKQLMDKVLDEIPPPVAPVQRTSVVILRHKVPKRAINNKSSLGVVRQTEGSYVDSAKDFSANLSNDVIPIKKFLLKTPSDGKSNPRLRKRLEQHQSQPNLHKLAVSNVLSRESSELYLHKRRQKSKDEL